MVKKTWKPDEDEMTKLASYLRGKIQYFLDGTLYSKPGMIGCHKYYDKVLGGEIPPRFPTRMPTREEIVRIKGWIKGRFGRDTGVEDWLLEFFGTCTCFNWDTGSKEYNIKLGRQTLKDVFGDKIVLHGGAVLSPDLIVVKGRRRGDPMYFVWGQEHANAGEIPVKIGDDVCGVYTTTKS